MYYGYLQATFSLDFKYGITLLYNKEKLVKLKGSAAETHLNIIVTVTK